MDPSFDRRKSRRKPLQAPALLSFDDQPGNECWTLDLSDTGARLLVPRTVLLPAQFELHVPARNITRRAKLVWRRGDDASIVFI